MNLRYLLCLLGVMSGLDGAVAARADYLASAGPAPLRFGSPAVAGKSTLPPLPPPAEVPPVTTPPSAINPGTGDSHSPIRSGDTSAQQSPDSNQTTLTPQMLIELFQKRLGEGKGREKRVIAPFGFEPPILQPKPSSSATYENQ